MKIVLVPNCFEKHDGLYFGTQFTDNSLALRDVFI